MSLRGASLDRLPAPVADAVATTLGQTHRNDPVAPSTGGPAGNARLTAWVGFVLLALFAVECVTLLSLGHMISLHIVIGGVLVPLAVLKTATTGWRIVRYYTGNADYRAAGPPPLVLRVLGPLVILASLAVLGSGLALIPLGRHSTTPFLSAAGFSVDAVTVHKASFVVWLAVVGLHVVTRFVSAVLVVRPHASSRVQGGVIRLAVVAVMTAVGLVVGFGVLHYSTGWTSHRITNELHDDRGD